MTCCRIESQYRGCVVGVMWSQRPLTVDTRRAAVSALIVAVSAECQLFQLVQRCSSQVGNKWMLVQLPVAGLQPISHIQNHRTCCFSLPIRAHNSSFPQILSSIVLLLFYSPDWLHRLQLFFVFLGHVGFNFGIVC